MKLTVLQPNLSRAVNIAARNVANRPQLPVLANILLSTDNGQLKLAATNLETSVNVWCGAKIETEGSFTVPARLLTETVSSFPADKVEITVSEGLLTMSCGRFTAKINGLSAEEFPKISSVDATKPDCPETSFSVADLAKIIDLIGFAGAMEDSGRPALTGALIEIKEQKQFWVATDGFRLSTFSLAAEDKRFNTLLIPHKALAEVRRLLAEKITTKNEVPVKMVILEKEKQIAFKFEDMELITRLIDEQFPDYQSNVLDKVAENQIKSWLEVDREELLRALKMAAIFSREAANIVRFDITTDQIKISANAAQVGENETTVESKNTGELPLQIAFNNRYLLDLLAVLKGAIIKIELTGPQSAALFLDPEEKDFLHVIMPVRIQE